MALVFTTLVRTRVVVGGAGLSVAIPVQPPSNCYHIIFLNRSVNLMLIGQGVAGGVLLDDGSNTALPALTPLAWPIPLESSRPDTFADLIIGGTVGGGNVDVTYLCGVEG